MNIQLIPLIFSLIFMSSIYCAAEKEQNQKKTLSIEEVRNNLLNEPFFFERFSELNAPMVVAGDKTLEKHITSLSPCTNKHNSANQTGSSPTRTCIVHTEQYTILGFSDGRFAVSNKKNVFVLYNNRIKGKKIPITALACGTMLWDFSQIEPSLSLIIGYNDGSLGFFEKKDEKVTCDTISPELQRPIMNIAHGALPDTFLYSVGRKLFHLKTVPSDRSAEIKRLIFMPKGAVITGIGTYGSCICYATSSGGFHSLVPYTEPEYKTIMDPGCDQQWLEGFYKELLKQRITIARAKLKKAKAALALEGIVVLSRYDE